MFSLIVTLISIALAAALVLAAVYYGGLVLSGQQVKAQAAAALNQAQQLDGAVRLFQVQEMRTPTELQELVTSNYLRTLPEGDWMLTGADVVRVDLSADQCLAANRQVGIDTVPACSDPAYANAQVCCAL